MFKFNKHHSIYHTTPHCPHTQGSSNTVLENNQLGQFLEVGKLSTTAGPENIWKVYDGWRKLDGKVRRDNIFLQQYLRAHIIIIMVLLKFIYLFKPLPRIWNVKTKEYILLSGLGGSIPKSDYLEKGITNWEQQLHTYDNKSLSLFLPLHWVSI